MSKGDFKLERNEYSTFGNPAGILNDVRFNLLVDLGNYAGISSGRAYIGMGTVVNYTQMHCKRVEALNNEISHLRSLPYDLNRQILIDSKCKVYKAVNCDLLRILSNIDAIRFLYTKSGKFYEKVTFAEFCKRALSLMYTRIHGNCSEVSKLAKQDYETVVNNLGNNALILGNSNVNSYKGGKF